MTPRGSEPSDRAPIPKKNCQADAANGIRKLTFEVLNTGYNEIGNQTILYESEIGLRQNNFLIPLTSLVGRKKEVEEVGQLLSATRLLTLLGPGGVGKTRLALEAVNTTAKIFKNGVCWVDLAYLVDPSLIPQTIVQVLDIYAAPNHPPLRAIDNYLQSKQLLLVIDNCEHLIAACAKLVEHLLSVCPKLHVLTVSREELGIFGEVTWHVPSLAFPDSQALPSIQNLLDYPSIQLFIERAAEVLPGYSLSEHNYRSIALICQKLDGLPLAIELAAARIKLLSAKEIADRLADRFDILTGGSRNALPRHQTLRAALDWSYELLNESEQCLFRCLSIFAGHFSLEAAEQVARLNHTIPDGSNFLDMLVQLVNKSLINVETQLLESKSDTHYRMLETIREYALEKLVTAGESITAHASFLKYYLWYAKEAESKLYNQEQATWSDQLEAEYENLRAAIEWSLGNKEIELGAQLILFLDRFWHFHGYYSEAVLWLNKILALPGMTDRTRSMLLLRRGHIAQAEGEYDQAMAFVKASLTLFVTQGDISGIAQAKAMIGIINALQGEREKGIMLLEESLITFRESGDEWQTARALLYIADSCNRMGNNKKAAPLCQESLAIFTKLGDTWGIAFASGCAGEIARQQGDLQRAKEYFRNALAIHWQLGQKGEIPYPLETLSLIAISEKDYVRAARLWGAAEVFREKANAPLPPAYQSDYRKYLTLAHEKLGEKAYTAARLEGQELSPAAVLALATHDGFIQLEIPSKIGNESALDFRLTKREIEILRLVATGMTDIQVAERLFLSPRTISKHLQSIYSKLNVNSRTAATHIALSHKIIEQ